MLNYDPLACLPSSEELPDSDDTPVDKVDGKRFLTSEERANYLAERLRSLGIDPDLI